MHATETNRTWLDVALREARAWRTLALCELALLAALVAALAARL